MTGIERLRDIAEDRYSGGMVHISVQKLREMCEQIEAEAGVETVKSDAMEALAFVEEHGGLDAVKKRLMPSGMEWLLEVWPKWSNGEYCKFGDWWVSDNYGEPKPKQFRKLSIYTPEQLDEWGQGDGESYGYEWDFVRPSDPKYRPDEVEPPAPKALDADGVEIRVGDTVWHKKSGMKFTVEFLPSERGYQSVHLTDYAGAGFIFDPNLLTHRAPVLAADGEPLEVGQTVYHIADGKEYTVEKLFKAGAMVTPDGITGGRCRAEYLTHECPESKCRDCAHWQKDPTADNMGVCWFFYHEHEGQDCYAARLGECGACEEFMPRAKALAGVSE